MKNTLTVKDLFGQEYQVTVEKNKSIQIDCTYTNHFNPKPTSVSFNIGDWAEYGSYNLSYMGNIVAISEKTVTIVAFQGTRNEETHRLKIGKFCWRNWNFDYEKKKAENAIESQYI